MTVTTVRHFLHTGGQLVRFVITGGGTALLFLSMSYGLVVAGIRPFWGHLCAYLLAFAVGYTIQRGWTFGGHHRHRRALPRYLILQAGCALLTGVVAQFSASLAGLSPLTLSVLTTCIAGIVSYVVSSLWVFPSGQYPE